MVGYKIGDLVEVIGYEEGFFGSYYEATVVRKLRRNEYMVCYKDLLKDDLSGPLPDVVTTKNLRPQPPEVPIEGFYPGLIVDVFANDGWWVGEIVGKVDDMYFVYFQSSNEELPYLDEEMRIHQEWTNGNWILCNQAESD